MASPRPFALVLSLTLAIVAMVSAHEEHKEVANKQVTLDDVCSNRQVPIISVQEARRLINDLKTNMEGCPMKYVQSFYELEPILSLDPNERLCGETKFAQISAYHFRYVNPQVETYKLGDDLNNLGKKIVKKPLDDSKVDYTVQLDDYKQEILIPISLQQFFKAWALQVSGLCKRTMVENLDKISQILTDSDYSLIDGPLEKHPVTEVPLPQRLTFDELVYMPHLEGELEPGDAELRDTITVLDLRSKPDINRMMHACERRFKPIYSKLVMPVVRLTKLGYEYQGSRIDDIRTKLDKDIETQKWMALTAMCESMGNFELVKSDDPNDEVETMPVLKYDPIYNYRIDNELWIKGAEALRKEFYLMRGRRATGFRKVVFKAGVAGRKVVAFVDPHQFAWYRRNQNTLSSGLNTASIGSNVLSIVLTLLGG